MKRSALFATCVLILACDPASETLDDADFAAVDSAGVEIVVNDGPDRPLRVERTVTIGTLDGPPERQFHQILAVEIGPEEDLWVSDARGTIRRFDLQGEYLGEIGGKGEGPGEDPTGWGEIVFSGDTILALGLRPRLQLFDEAVRHALAVTMPEIFGLPRQYEPSDEEVKSFVHSITPATEPTALPALDELLVTADGHVWVRRADRHPDPRLLAIARAMGFARRIWPEAWRGPSHFDLFAPDGRYRGTAVLPASFVPMFVSRDAIFGVTRDDFDVEYVVGYEISSRGPDAAGVTDRQSNPSVGPSDVLAFRITLP